MFRTFSIDWFPESRLARRQVINSTPYQITYCGNANAPERAQVHKAGHRYQTGQTVSNVLAVWPARRDTDRLQTGERVQCRSFEMGEESRFLSHFVGFRFHSCHRLSGWPLKSTKNFVPHERTVPEWAEDRTQDLL